MSQLQRLLGLFSLIILFNIQSIAGVVIGHIFSSQNINEHYSLEHSNQSLTNRLYFPGSDFELFFEVEDIFENDSKNSEQEATERFNSSIANNNLFSKLLEKYTKSSTANFLESLQNKITVPLYVFYQSRKIYFSL